MRRLIAVLIGLWLGMQIGFGYIAASILFDHLERMTAGNIAGSLFHWVNNIGLIVWFLAFWVCHRDTRRCRKFGTIKRFIVVLWVLTAINEFLITPVIEALKTKQPYWLLSWLGGNFGTWHGISSLIYLLTTLIGLCLCLTLLRWREPIH